ncbi:10389_t:CDS:2, partial [Paraglomus occultum]
RKRKLAHEIKAETQDETVVVDTRVTKSAKKNKKERPKSKASEVDAKTETQIKDETVIIDTQVAKPSKKKVKRTKTEQTIEMSATFATRLTNVTKLLGAHVSIAGGVHNAVNNGLQIGANAFAIFLKNQRKWDSAPMTADQIASFQSACKEHNYPAHCILPHGSYLINLANPDAQKRERSYQSFLDDIKRCEDLGLLLYNFHPGSTVGKCTIEQSIGHIADCINRVHEETSNIAGAGNVVGSKFEELGAIIAKVIDKNRVGVCIDTCHTFAAGYDLRTKSAYEKTMTELFKHINPKYLRGMHLNDSLSELGSNRDRHANIGKGHIGLEAFRLIMNDHRLDNIPLVLETPVGSDDVYAQEIELLYSLVGKKEGDVTIKRG